jgi:hypothetical protein
MCYVSLSYYSVYHIDYWCLVWVVLWNKRLPCNRLPRAQRWSRGTALLILNLGARRGGWSAPRPGRFTPGKDSVPIVWEAGWAPGLAWTYAKNLAHTGIRPQTVDPATSRIMKYQLYLTWGRDTCKQAEAVVRMLVKFSSTVVKSDWPQQDLGSSFATACRILLPTHTTPKQVQADDRGVCSWY